MSNARANYRHGQLRCGTSHQPGPPWPAPRRPRSVKVVVTDIDRPSLATVRCCNCDRSLTTTATAADCRAGARRPSQLGWPTVRPSSAAESVSGPPAAATPVNSTASLFASIGQYTKCYGQGRTRELQLRPSHSPAAVNISEQSNV